MFIIFIIIHIINHTKKYITFQLIGNLGNIYSDQGKLAEAEVQYLRAIELTEKAYGKDHPSLANNIGMVPLYYY